MLNAYACPNCDTDLTPKQSCASCGLDGSLICYLLERARALDLGALKAAAQGRWQDAYDTACTRLELSSRQSDVAAFIMLLSAVAGGVARGPRRIPRPRPEQLPAELAPHVDDLIEEASRLRSLSMPDEATGTQELLGLIPNSWGLTSVTETSTLISASASISEEMSADGDNRNLAPSDRTLRQILAALLAVVMGLVIGWKGAQRVADWQDPRDSPRASSIPVLPPLQLEPSAAQDAIEIQSLGIESVLVAAHLERWGEALEILAQLPAGTLADSELAREIHARGGRALWLRALDAHRRGGHRDSRRWLELAATVPAGLYFRDDALFFLAWTYQHEGDVELARVTYERFLAETQGSEYVSEARRLLAALKS